MVSISRLLHKRLVLIFSSVESALVPSLVPEDSTRLEFCFYAKAESIQPSSEAACLHLQWRHQEESCGSQSEPCFLISPSPAWDSPSCQHRERDALHARWRRHHHHHHHLIPYLKHQLNHGYYWMVRAAPSLFFSLSTSISGGSFTNCQMHC